LLNDGAVGTQFSYTAATLNQLNYELWFVDEKEANNGFVLNSFSPAACIITPLIVEFGLYNFEGGQVNSVWVHCLFSHLSQSFTILLFYCS
jgi:hypothetical protein